MKFIKAFKVIQLLPTEYGRVKEDVIFEETKKKFTEKWKETNVDIEEDNARRSKILEVVKPLIGTDPKKTVVEIPEVQKIIGDAKVCWGCASSTCLIRQILSGRLAKIKILITLLETKVEKNKQVAAYKPKKKGEK